MLFIPLSPTVLTCVLKHWETYLPPAMKDWLYTGEQLGTEHLAVHKVRTYTTSYWSGQYNHQGPSGSLKVPALQHYTTTTTTSTDSSVFTNAATTTTTLHHHHNHYFRHHYLYHLNHSHHYKHYLPPPLSPPPYLYAKGVPVPGVRRLVTVDRAPTAPLVYVSLTSRPVSWRRLPTYLVIVSGHCGVQLIR